MPSDYFREVFIKKALKEEFRHMGFLRRLMRSMFKTSDFFYLVKTENSLRDSLRFIAGVYFTAIIIYMAIMFLGSSAMLSIPEPNIFLVTTVFFFWLLPIVASFLCAVMIHIFIKVLHGKGNYIDTYKAVAYSQGPMIFLIAFLTIPIYDIYLSIAVVIFEFFILIVGISKLHSLSKKHAILSVLLPVVIISIILLYYVPISLIVQLAR